MLLNLFDKETWGNRLANVIHPGYANTGPQEPTPIPGPFISLSLQELMPPLKYILPPNPQLSFKDSKKI